MTLPVSLVDQAAEVVKEAPLKPSGWRTVALGLLVVIGVLGWVSYSLALSTVLNDRASALHQIDVNTRRLDADDIKLQRIDADMFKLDVMQNDIGWIKRYLNAQNVQVYGGAVKTSPDGH